jgi:hypothetical protein
MFTSCSKTLETKSNSEDIDCSIYADGVKFEEDCNICVCYAGEKSCTQNDCSITNDDSILLQNESINTSKQKNETKTSEDLFRDFMDSVNFNANLTDFENSWLVYLEIKYPRSKIYHIKTTNINCLDCYEVYYKKDRIIIKIKVLDGNLQQETEIVNDLAVEIDNKPVCTLFQGTWNPCPKLCPTDEEVCLTTCGKPICEFDEDKIILKELGEICGGLDEGECVYGLTCYHENENSTYGKCVKWERGKIII